MPRKTYGLWVWGVKSWFQDHHVSPEAKPCSNFPKKFETILKGHGIVIAKFQEIPWGYACAPNHQRWGMTMGQKIQTPLRHVNLLIAISSNVFVGDRIWQAAVSADAWHSVTFFQKVVPFSQTRPSYLFLLKIKIVVYVLDSLDTIPKNSEADIAQCREKQIKEC